MPACGIHTAEGMPSSSCRTCRMCSTQYALIESQQRSAYSCACAQQAVAVLGNLPWKVVQPCSTYPLQAMQSLSNYAVTELSSSLDGVP